MRKAFTVIEIIGVFVLFAIVAALATSRGDLVREGASEQAMKVTLTSAQLAVRASLVDGVLPGDITAVDPKGVDLVGVPSTSGGTLSVSRVDDTTYVLAGATSDGCLYLVDIVGGATAWARATTGTCDAGDLDRTMVTGDVDEPTELS